MVRGLNPVQIIRKGQARTGSPKNAAALLSEISSAAETSACSAPPGRFRIAGGVAHNEDLNVKSPLLRPSGTGDIDPARPSAQNHDRIGSARPQGGLNYSRSRRHDPVKLSDPFTAIG